jgi:hypothetical protein
MFTWTTPMATTELASPAMLSPCHSVSGRNDVIYPPEFEEESFCDLRLDGVLQSSHRIFIHITVSAILVRRQVAREWYRDVS